MSVIARVTRRPLIVRRRLCYETSSRPLIRTCSSLTTRTRICRTLLTHSSWLCYPTRLLATMAACLPCYPVTSDNVIILEHPQQFYQMLKDEIAQATRRITMAALYLGSDKLERELVECLSKRLDESNIDLVILLDHARGTRGSTNSCTLLQCLVDKFDSRTHIALYHTPHLRGLLKAYLPGKFSESVGLNHIKVFVFDDNVLISGANLSESYFTNRQDRYIMIKDCRELADYFHELVSTIGTFSMELRPGGDIEPHDECPAHPYHGDPDTFIQVAKSRILTFIQSKLPENSVHLNSMTTADFERELDSEILVSTRGCESDTCIYPLIQMGPLDIRFDELMLNSLFEKSPVGSTIHLASGYFNLTDDYIDKMVNTSMSRYHILTASPYVNGFYGARGVAGAVPDVYTTVARQFFNKLQQTNTTDRIKLYEYYRDGWTFHVKGLWYCSPGSQRPCMTMIGSPNFGYRSVYRDLEAQIAIVTRNEELMRRMNEERLRVYGMAREVGRETFDDPDRRVPLWVRVGTRFLKSFF